MKMFGGRSSIIDCSPRVASIQGSLARVLAFWSTDSSIELRRRRPPD